MAVGLLEAFGLIEEYGRKVLTVDEILFAADARKRKGCRTIRSTLLDDERKRVLEMGRRIKKWKDEQK